MFLVYDLNYLDVSIDSNSWFLEVGINKKLQFSNIPTVTLYFAYSSCSDLIRQYLSSVISNVSKTKQKNAIYLDIPYAIHSLTSLPKQNFRHCPTKQSRSIHILRSRIIKKNYVHELTCITNQCRRKACKSVGVGQVVTWFGIISPHLFRQVQLICSCLDLPKSGEGA